MIQIQAINSPNQSLSVVLAQQNAQIVIRQNGGNIYFDLKVDDSPIVVGRLCQDRQRLLLDAKYRGFIGDFVWFDINGTNRPFYTGIGSRYFLMYLEAGE